LTSNAIDVPGDYAAPVHQVPRPPAHMPALDGLRGLAILLVLACHTNLFTSWGPATVGKVGYLLSGAGWVGVDLFFVLSGFLITGILLSTRESQSYYKSFFARRFLRIFPLYYTFLGSLFLWKHALYSKAETASLLFYYYNLYAVAIGHHLLFVNSLWSLAVEEQFYLGWPFIVAVCSRKTLEKVCYAGIVLALALRLIVLGHSTSFQDAYYLTPCRIDNLLLGALLAIWKEDRVVWKLVQRWSATVIIVCAGGIICIALWTGHFLDSVVVGHEGALHHSSALVIGPGITLVAWLFGGLLVKCTKQGPIQDLFLNRTLRKMGKYSYGMYMFHWPVLVLLQHQLLRVMGSHAGSYLQGYIFFVTVIGVTFLMAYISFNLFEKRFLSLKRFFPAL
jgi:peptidoglycan/LPS O-acetylase OafA/YrhL